jgi:deoxycytidine triphosphate deaminase
VAKILSDREIKNLLASDIVKGADEKCINPNGIALRVGRHVRFISTKEDKELSPGKYLRVIPGETVLIASLESIDFRAQTVHQHFENCALMAWISPITDMMREGIAQVTSKIDAGILETSIGVSAIIRAQIY